MPPDANTYSGTSKKTYSGTSKKGYQDALDKAVAAALRAAPGADRTLKWTLKSVSGTAGGVVPSTQVKVSIEATFD